MNTDQIFNGLTFAFDGLALKEKNELTSLIKKYGGSISYSLGQKVTHFVVALNFKPTPYQAGIITRHSVAVIKPEFIVQSTSKGRLLPTEEFLVSLEVSVDTSDPIPDTEGPNQDETNVIAANGIKNSVETAAAASPKIKKKIISGRNKNQKKVIFVQQEPTETLSSSAGIPSVLPTTNSLKFSRAQMSSHNTVLSVAWSGAKVKKLLGRLKDEAAVETPALVDTSGYLTKLVSCGAYHSALINHEGQLMTWGSNGLRLGLDNSTGTASPTVVSGLADCVLVSCSATQTAVLTGANTLVVFDDHTGRTSYDVSSCGNIIEICSGTGVTAVLNAEHRLWLLGKLAKKTYGLDEPLNGTFKSVHFGTEHCVLVTTAGEVMALGSNGSGQLGLGDKKDRVQAERITGLNRVKLVAAGDQHSAAVTEGGGLYVWGASPHGHEDVLAPVMFAKDCASLTKLGLSKDRLVALSAGGDVLEWSLPEFGRQARRTTRAVEYRIVYERAAVNISCGAYHCLIEQRADAQQFVREGTPRLIADLLAVMGDEAVNSVDEFNNTLLHAATYNLDSCGALTALLEHSAAWQFEASNLRGQTAAELCAARNDVRSIKVLADRRVQLEQALIIAARQFYDEMVDFLLTCRVDRVRAFGILLNDFVYLEEPLEIKRKRLSNLKKVARAGGLLGLEYFASAVEHDIFSSAKQLLKDLKEKYPAKFGLIHGSSDQTLAAKFAQDLQFYGTRLLADTWNHTEFTAENTSTLLAILSADSLKERPFLNKLITAYTSGRHIIPVWLDHEQIELGPELKKKLKSMFVKSGLRFAIEQATFGTDAYYELTRGFSNQLSALNKSVRAPRPAKVSAEEFPSEDVAAVPLLKSARSEFRVYVSTTLGDMEVERNLLLTKVFPAIEALCAERGVPFSFVDMNIGAQSEICSNDSRLLSSFEMIDKWYARYLNALQSLTRCSTCFVGLFGERYGWHSQHGGAEQFMKNLGVVAESGHKWVEAFNNRSVNELEVIHAVLKYLPQEQLGSFAESYGEPAGPLNKDCLFYYRDQSYLQQFPMKKKPQYACESYSAKSLLSDMKYRLNLSGVPSKNYRTPNDFATAILNDLKKSLDKRFPIGSPQSTTADREVDNQWMLVKHFSSMAAPIYTRTRTLVHNYVNSGAHQPLTLLGEEGAGKTFLLAAVAAEYKRLNPQALVTFNSVGLTRSSDATGIMLGVMTQIRETYSNDESLPLWPDEADCVSALFPKWLEFGGAKGPLLVLIDGAEKLDRDAWIPAHLPPNVKMVLTSLPNGLTQSFCVTMNLNESDIETLLTHWIKSARAASAGSQGDLVDLTEATRRLSANPNALTNLSFVKTFAEELCRISLQSDVDATVEKLENITSLNRLAAEFMLPNLLKEVSDGKKVLGALAACTSIQETCTKGQIPFDVAFRLVHLMRDRLALLAGDVFCNTKAAVVGQTPFIANETLSQIRSATILMKNGDLNSTISALDRCLALTTSHFGPLSKSAHRVSVALATLYAKNGDPAKAVEIHESVRRFSEQQASSLFSESFFELDFALATSLLEAGCYRHANGLLVQTWQTVSKAFDQSHRCVVRCLDLLQQSHGYAGNTQFVLSIRSAVTHFVQFGIDNKLLKKDQRSGRVQLHGIKPAEVNVRPFTLQKVAERPKSKIILYEAGHFSRLEAQQRGTTAPLTVWDLGRLNIIKPVQAVDISLTKTPQTAPKADKDSESDYEWMNLFD